MWNGVILEESLTDKSILKKVSIKKSNRTTLEKTGQVATFHDVTVEDDNFDEVCKLAMRSLKSKKFYVHFWQGDRMVVIFPNKRFNFSRHDHVIIESARTYGKILGIPAEQMQFEKLFV